ncbi:HD-GYP domain-containing protein [Virgibacillus kekensis]|uniref:HD-GYP domain-containing protein n=1 Tax=Virgibacillus kekensis TaxID=202261 RepID=A0ABV9DJU7_9BACI
MKRTPESLFENIAQDNEVLQIFKHHSMRVMYLSSMLAKKIGCYDEDLRVAAFLHDIGKIGVAKEILLKPAKLSSVERAVVESHCHIGNVIIRKELGKTRAAEFVRDHHENWNGSGYPRRLIGEQISMQGRIIRICDSFDTMTYDIRNYKSSTMTYYDAFEELRRCSWTQFDGNLVDTFINLLMELEIPDSWYDQYNAEFIKKIYKGIDAPHDIL